MVGRNDLCGCIGTSFQAKRWLVLDACGWLGISFSWSVHLFALVAIATQLVSGSIVSKALYIFIYIPLSLLAMSSLFMAWTTDPGAVPMGARPLVIIRRAASNMTDASRTPSSDNGSVVSSATRRALRRCHKCHDNYKPPRAHHDSVTGRCIVKFDHFCPWVGNAIGALNHKYFCLFLLYTASCCVMSLMLIFLRVVHCGYVKDQNDAIGPEETLHTTDEGSNTSTSSMSSMSALLSESSPSLVETHDRIRWLEDTLLSAETTTTALTSTSSALYVYDNCNDFYTNHVVLALFLCSVIFLIFTCTMGCEQVEAIETGQGKIARMKMRVGRAGTEFNRVTEEFNEMFGGRSNHVAWHWFWPFTTVQYPRGMKQVVLGYIWDNTFPPEPYFEAGEEGSVCSPASTGGVPNDSGGLDHPDLEMQELDKRLRPPPLPLPSRDLSPLEREESDASASAESRPLSATPTSSSSSSSSLHGHRRRNGIASRQANEDAIKIV